MTTPIYRFEHKIIGRSDGKKAVGASAYRSGGRNMGGSKSVAASAAYRSGDTLTDERSGETFNYKNKFGILASEIILPENAPSWMADREKLWNAVEHSEKRKDSQLAREALITLPYGLPHEQLQMLVRGFARQEFVAKGMVADMAFHLYGHPYRLGDEDLPPKLEEWKAKELPFIRRGDTPAYEGQPHILEDINRKGEVQGYRLYQPHVHIMLTMRNIDAAAEHGFGLKNRSWNEHSNASTWREKWANIGADALAAAGMAIEAERYRVGYLDLEGQREVALARGDDVWARELDREPQTKIGPVARKMEAEGRESHAGNDNRGVIARNEEIVALYDKLDEARAKRSAAAAAVLDDIREGKAMEVEPPTEERLRQQHERETELWHQAEKALEEQERQQGVRQLLDQTQKDAEEAEKTKARRREEDRARAEAGDITDAKGRYAQALGDRYSMRDPFEGLCRAAMQEYAMFHKGQQDLREQAAKEKDDGKRHVIELRREIEAHEYMAITSHRIAGISRGITLSNNPAAEIDDERGKAYQREANALRDERTALQKDIRQQDVQEVRDLLAQHGIPPLRRDEGNRPAADRAPGPLRDPPPAGQERHHPDYVDPRGHAGQEGAVTAGNPRHTKSKVDQDREDAAWERARLAAEQARSPKPAPQAEPNANGTQPPEPARPENAPSAAQPVASEVHPHQAETPRPDQPQAALTPAQGSAGELGSGDAGRIKDGRSDAAGGTPTRGTDQGRYQQLKQPTQEAPGKPQGRDDSGASNHRRDDDENQARDDKARKDTDAAAKSSQGSKDYGKADSTTRDSAEDTARAERMAGLRAAFVAAQSGEGKGMDTGGRSGGGRGR